MKIQVRLIGVAGIIGAACVLTGCSSPALYVEKDPKVLPEKPITVHFLGVTKEEKAKLAREDSPYWAYEYWKKYLADDFPVRPGARYAVQVSNSFRLTSENPIWETWRGSRVTHVFVVADIALNKGPWCVSVPFTPKRWEDKTAGVVIDPNGLSVGSRTK